MFTPSLASTYSLLESSGKKFEVVFVSSDKNSHQFTEYYGEMPWACLDYEDRDRKNALSARFGVQGIPTLVLMGPDGEVFQTQVRTQNKDLKLLWF